MARLHRKLQLLGGKSAAGFYSGGVFGQKVHDRFFGKGSRSFRKQVQKLMLDIAVTVTLEIISMSKGTTGNTASAWYISIDENEHDYGKFQNDPQMDRCMAAFDDTVEYRAQKIPGKRLVFHLPALIEFRMPGSVYRKCGEGSHRPF